jgi:hypothetical protein
MKQRKI